MKDFPFLRQSGAKDCGPACLKMICLFHNIQLADNIIRKVIHSKEKEVSFLELSKAAKKVGLLARGVKIDMNEFIRNAPLPCIVHWNHMHFVVVQRIVNNSISIADPSSGFHEYSDEEFSKGFCVDGKYGYALFIYKPAKV